MTTRLARVWLVIAAILAGGAGSPDALAAAKAKKVDAGPQHEVNACGCYRDTAGACFCGKKGACACPGDCEPKGCEAKHEKEMKKQMAAETKKAHEADQKQRSHEKAARTAERAKAKKKADGAGP